MKALQNLLILDNTNMQPTYFIFIGVGAAVVIALVIFFIIFFSKKKKGAKITSSEWLEALGNKENIKAVKGVGSRLTVNLNNQDLVNKEKLKELGVSNIVTMSDKMILVIENQAEKIANELAKDL